jgi:hypothetical protein
MLPRAIFAAWVPALRRSVVTLRRVRDTRAPTIPLGDRVREGAIDDLGGVAFLLDHEADHSAASPRAI